MRVVRRSRRPLPAGRSGERADRRDEACSFAGRRLASLLRLALTARLAYTRAVGSGEAFVHVGAALRSGYSDDRACHTLLISAAPT